MQRTYLLIGGNMGNKLDNLATASSLLEQHIGKTIAVSNIYKTAAWGKEDQPHFYNQAIAIDTLLTPTALLSTILQIETQMGRTREEHWGQRIMDIDILFYGNEIIETQRLIIPHPYLHKRNFALVPLNEIASGLVHPILLKNIETLCTESVDTLAVEIVE